MECGRGGARVVTQNVASGAVRGGFVMTRLRVGCAEIRHVA
jgi:hypothetical protein